MSETIGNLVREHEWSERTFSGFKIVCCDVCGFVKNFEQPNKPFRGPVTVGPKSAATLKPLDG